MIFEELGVDGSVLIHLDESADERGFFARAWSKDEFAARSLDTTIAQANLSLSREPGTLRGLHYQVAPVSEAKVVRCIQGAIYDVVVDIRFGSPTHGEWIAANLTAENRQSLYVPAGCAHGFQALAPNTEVFYTVSEAYSPDHERGIRYDDPSFNVRWPLDVTAISAKDMGWPDFAAGYDTTGG